MGVWTWLRRRKPKAEAAEAVVALAEPEPERRLLTSKWDPAEVKKALDECFARALLDAGYAEDHHVGNTKAGLGVATCATALLAQFYPVPFPRNYWLLTACCVVYFVLNSVLQAYSVMCERDVVLATLPGDDGREALALSSSLPKYGETYTLTLQDAARARPAVVLSRSVAAWIYDDGEVHLPGITADAARLLADLQAAKKRENKKQR